MYRRRVALCVGGLVAFIGTHIAIDLYLMPIVRAQRWDLVERPYVRKQPVATFRPTIDNSPMAIDITPNGKALPDAERGVAWVDPCDSDIRSADNNNPTTCLGLSVGIPPENTNATKQRDVAFGTYNYDGAKGARFFIVKDRKKIGEFVDGGLVIYGTVTARDFVRKRDADVAVSLQAQ